MNEPNVKRLNRILTYLFNQIKEMQNEGRDLPIEWNVMHMYSSVQLAEIMAIKRNLNIELAGIIAAIHDITVIITGKRKNHAEEAEPHIHDIINHYNLELRKTLNPITDEEKSIIVEAIIQHSAKEEYTNNPYVELIKDVDSLDRFLHGIKTDNDYYKRTEKTFAELNIKMNNNGGE